MKDINQKRGPTVGNAGNAEKRRAFTTEKSTANSKRGEIATMIVTALENRGRGTRAYVDPATEGLHQNTGPKTNPTANGSRLSSKYKTPRK